MAKIITPFLLAILLTGCFEAQRALGCNDTGVLGCKDEPSDIQPPDPELRPAPSGGRSLPRPNPREQAPEVTASGYLEHHQYPWSQPLNECMAAGGLRTECFKKLPPDILVQFEAWEADRAAIRRRQFQQRRELENSPLFGVEPNGPNT